MTDTLPSPNVICPACAQGFVCGMVAGATQCWCYALPHKLPVPAAAMTHTGDNPPPTGCFCPNCLPLRLTVPPLRLDVVPTALTDSDRL